MSLGRDPHNSSIESEDNKQSSQPNGGSVVSSSVFSNPILNKQKGNGHSARTSANKLYSGYSNVINKPSSINYQEILKYMNEVFSTKTEIAQLFYSMHNVLTNKMQTSFTALGLINPQSNCINIRLIDKIGSSYSSRVMLNAEDNPLVKCYEEKVPQASEDTTFFNMSYLNSSPVSIFPLVSFGDCMGILAIGGHQNAAMADELYQSFANYLGVFVHNRNLAELVEKNTDTDSLTGLANHKYFHEEFNKQIQICDKDGTQLSICIFDIANISQINRDLGYAKGDEIIKTVARKIAESIRNTDFAGRYGGDEIGIIMPNTSSEEAKYIAEYLSYTLTCIFIDDVGPIKLNAGIATYPNASKNQEKLLILAEQAMYISQGKSSENGRSVIVTSEDVDFWDDTALKSFAEVLTKRHAQVGIDFEDELVKKFHNEKIISSKHLLEVVTSLAGTIDAKDTYTKGHSTSVSRYSEALARAINLPDAEVERIRLGALLHDIGKIGIPENVLRKPTMLTEEEWEIMKQHPVIGAEKVLAPNESLRDLIPMVKFHHEHWDGSGYPFGLKGDEIPLSARIVSIADAYHALVSDRPYRKGLSTEKACEILKMGAGVQWDKNLIRQFILIAPSLSTSV